VAFAVLMGSGEWGVGSGEWGDGEEITNAPCPILS
jgi:hypothetical protein